MCDTRCCGLWFCFDWKLLTIPSRPSSHNCDYPNLFLVTLLDQVGGRALSAVVAVEVSGHEGAGSAELMRAGLSEALDLVVRVDLVVLKDGELDLLVLVANLLGLGVNSLLLLLSTTDHGDGNIEGALLWGNVYEEYELVKTYLSETGLRDQSLGGQIRAGIDEAGFQSLDGALGGNGVHDGLNGGTRSDLNGQKTDWGSDKDLHLKQPNRYKFD